MLGPYLYFSHEINQYGRANQPEGFNFPEYSDLWISVVFMFGYLIINRLAHVIFRPLWDGMVKGQHDPIVKERYLKKTCESASKMVIYLIHFTWGWRTLYATNWVPSFLLGDGDFMNTIIGMPFVPCPHSIHMLCLSFLGMFLAFEVDHCMQTDRPDWNEMFAHHICSIALTFGMIFTNNRQLGVIVAWQQTIADIFVSLSRITSSMPAIWPMLVSYVIMMALWLWTRVYNFGVITIRVINEMAYPPELARFNIHVNLYCVFMCVLYSL